MFFQNPPYMASRHLLILRIAAVGTSFSPLLCQAWHGYGVTIAHRVEVEVGADGPASAPLSGAAAAAPPAGARAVDGSVRACISSLCSCNTKRTRVCTSCNNPNRYATSCETGSDGRMLNIRSGGSSGENPKLASNGACSILSARDALYANSTCGSRVVQSEPS
jgi:hypothetical protein